MIEVRSEMMQKEKKKQPTLLVKERDPHNLQV